MRIQAGEIGRLTRYGIVGAGSNVTVYLVFLGLVAARIEPVVATGVCYGVGLVLGYLLHRTVTFRSEAPHSRDGWRFGVAQLAGFLAAIACMGALKAPLGPALAQVAVILVAAMVIYGVLFALRFGRMTGQ